MLLCMRWQRMRRLIPALAAALTGCGSASHAVTTTVVSPRPETALVSATSQTPTAGICPLSHGSLITIYVGDGTPEPRCLRVRGAQRLQVVNKVGPSGPADKTTTVRWPPFGRRRLTPGSAVVFGENFGSYLAPGDHIIRISKYGGGGAEVLLVP
jgi:hypothetical protein